MAGALGRHVLMQRLNPSDTSLPIAIEAMRQSSLPLAVYGAGSIAQAAIPYLRQAGVKVDAIFIDDIDLMNSSREYVSGTAMHSLSTLCNQWESFNVYVGFADFNAKHAAKLRSIKNIANIFHLDNYFAFGCDEIDPSYVNSNLGKYADTYNMLEDQLSKDVFVGFLNVRMSGNPVYFSEFPLTKQYFPPDIIQLSDKEVFIDCGAYDGDTILKFRKECDNRFAHIYALEPDVDNFTRLQKQLNDEAFVNYSLFKCGAYDNKGHLSFNCGFNGTSKISDQGNAIIEVDTIDNIINDSRVTYIKMDVEGAEMSALIGARQTICRNKPKLAISAYHKREDLIEIPRYIAELDSQYKLYLRPHRRYTIDVVLYAIPQYPRG
jgi:FkbM family methyltransferase